MSTRLIDIKQTTWIMASHWEVGLLFLFYQTIIGALIIFQKQLFIWCGL